MSYQIEGFQINMKLNLLNLYKSFFAFNIILIQFIKKIVELMSIYNNSVFFNLMFIYKLNLTFN